MICLHCAQPIRSCPVGDYCWCNGYIHDSETQHGFGHKCLPEHQPKDGWPLANLAEPDWSKWGQPAMALAESAAAALDRLAPASPIGYMGKHRAPLPAWHGSDDPFYAASADAPDYQHPEDDDGGE